MRLLSRLLLQGLILEQVFATSEPPCKVSSIPEGLNPSGGRFEWKCTKIKNGKRKCKPKCVGDAGKKQTYTIACVNKNNSNTWTVFRGSAPSCTATVVKCLADAIPSRFKPAGAHTFVCKRHNVGSSCKVKCLNGGDSGDFVVRCKNKKNIWTIRKGITVPTCSETTTAQPTTEPSQPTCIPDEFKWCIAWGDPHFTTFDGEFHHLQPQCEYVMAKVDAAEYSNMPAFKIIGDFAPLEPGSSLTYTQGFTFEFPGQDQSPDEFPRYVISVEREDLRDQNSTSGIRRSTLEDRLTGNSYDSSFLVDDFDLTITPTTVEIETWFDVYIKYTAWGAADVRKLKLEIKVPDCYAHNIDGLCGNFDGQQYDEFSPGTSGSLTDDLDNWQTTQENLYEWAEQFELPDEQCHHIFGLNCAVDINHAITACIALDPDNTDSVFAPCNGDKSNAFLSCVTEKCDQSDECPAFASFAKECINDLGPEERGPVCDWATGLGCSTACGANAVFEGCADTCAARRTCRNRHQTDIERCGANTEIDSMCVCQPGFILDGDDCIPEENCGCTENGYYYSLGSTFQKPVYNPEENCECTSSGIVCTPIPCDQMERGHCQVMSDPWITTFDNTYYAFHGSCRYNLVKTEDTEDRAGFSIDISNRGSSRWTDQSGSHSGTVVDQIWLEAHSSDYVFGDQKRYYFHVNNRDNSANYYNTELDITLYDRVTGQTYFNTDFYNDDISLKITLSDDRYKAGYNLRAHGSGLEINYKHWYWWMDVYVSSCYKESISGLCGDWDGNSDISMAQDYENDPDEFGDRFMTAQLSDECTHGRFFEPCEDLTPAEFTAAIDRCDSLEDGTDQADVFSSCNFVSDKQGYYDRCLWNSCLDLACGSIQSFAHECLLRKIEGTADFNKICNWPQVTSCTSDCSGGQVFKGCTNACKEERTCDDVVNRVSDADRCGSERSIDAMCGCLDGQVMHNGECINEADCCPDPCAGLDDCVSIVDGCAIAPSQTNLLATLPATVNYKFSADVFCDKSNDNTATEDQRWSQIFRVTAGGDHAVPGDRTFGLWRMPLDNQYYFSVTDPNRTWYQYRFHPTTCTQGDWNTFSVEVRQIDGSSTLQYIVSIDGVQQHVGTYDQSDTKTTGDLYAYVGGPIVADYHVRNFYYQTFPTMKTCVAFKNMGNTLADWATAKASCNSIGADLSYFKNEAELAAYHTVKNDRREWIGIERKNGNQWFTVAGEESSVYDWYCQTGCEPNNAGGVENCVQSYESNYGYKWNDRDCAWEGLFSCRIEKIVPLDADCTKVTNAGTIIVSSGQVSGKIQRFDWDGESLSEGIVVGNFETSRTTLLFPFSMADECGLTQTTSYSLGAFTQIHDTQAASFFSDGTKMDLDFGLPSSGSTLGPLYGALFGKINGQYYVFGGYTNAYAIYSIDGCEMKELPIKLTTQYGVYGPEVRTLVHADGNERAYICFTELYTIDKRGCDTFDGSEVVTSPYKSITSRSEPSIAYYRDGLLVFGGSEYDSSTSDWIYKKSAEIFTSDVGFVPTTDLLAGMWGMTSATIGGDRVFSFGGNVDGMITFNSVVNNKVYMYYEGVWSDLGSMVANNYRMSAIAFDFNVPRMKTCVEFKNMGDTPVDWNTAKTSCNNIGAELSYFNNEEELSAYNAFKTVRREWIGIERKNGNQWFTVAGEESTVYDWYGNEPNNVGGIENCVESYEQQQQFKWNDRDCAHERLFSCRIEKIVSINDNC